MSAALKTFLILLFGNLVKGTIFENIVLGIGAVFVLFISFVIVKSYVEELKYKKCKHGNRRICVFCEREEAEINNNDHINVNDEKIVIHPAYINELLLFFDLPASTNDLLTVKNAYRKSLKLNHPDVGGSNKITKSIIENYKELETYFSHSS